MNALTQTLNKIQKKTKKKASVGIILGSGLGSIARQVSSAEHFSCKSLPHFVSSTVPGHAGTFILGKLFEKDVALMNGRFHSYEGYGFEEITYPVRVMKALGVKKIIITNAAGALNENFSAGNLVAITDHINLLDTSALYGASLLQEKEDAFLDVSSLYDKKLLQLAHTSAFAIGMHLREGVYAAVKGPCFETPSEARMLGILGADMVGMSTVPEAIAAKYLGLRVLGISAITNRSGSTFGEHDEVLKTVKKSAQELLRLLEEMFKTI
ncbi:MAG: purine-nucleoside phosphorylase [bacterium]